VVVQTPLVTLRINFEITESLNWRTKTFLGFLPFGLYFRDDGDFVNVTKSSLSAGRGSALFLCYHVDDVRDLLCIFSPRYGRQEKKA